MKREQFQVTSNAGHIVIKNAWNSSIRETEHLIRETAREQGVIYHLTSYHSDKEGSYHVRGVREWTGENGNVITFTIRKIA